MTNRSDIFRRPHRGRRLRRAGPGRRLDDGWSRLHSAPTEERPVASGDAEADSHGNPGRETPQLHAAARQQPAHSALSAGEGRASNSQL